MNATNHAILQSLVSTAAAGPLGWGAEERNSLLEGRELLPRGAFSAGTQPGSHSPTLKSCFLLQLHVCPADLMLDSWVHTGSGHYASCVGLSDLWGGS
jgi:hypothetical protein